MHESFAVKFLQIKVMLRKKCRHDSNIYFTRRRNDMQGRRSPREGGRWGRIDTGQRPPVLNWDEKCPFSIFLSLFNQSIFKCKSSFPDVFYEKDVLKNFAKFTGKHLCWRLFFNKVAGCRPAILF